MTVGKIVDYGLKDSQNMGRMYGSGSLRYDHPRIWKIFEKKKKKIMTGSLPEISDMWGQSILFDLMREKEYDNQRKTYGLWDDNI